MTRRDIVVIGCSTGGIDALQVIVSGLPRDFPGSIFVVMHTGPASPNVLDRLLERAGPLPVSNARDGEQWQSGHIYVAPADQHLVLDKKGIVRLTRGPKENRFRPAIDPLFRSAAFAFGERVVGVVLTGYLDDATAGLWAVKERGGVAIVQNPEEAIAPAMPMSALKQVEVDYCVKLHRVAPLLVELASRPVEEKEPRPVPRSMEGEVKIAEEANALSSGILEWTEPSLFTCPECHGVLMQLKEGGNLRFRCHTGHGFSMESLLNEIEGATEQSLWNAVRSFEEASLLLSRMAALLRENKHVAAAEALHAKADQARNQLELIREIALQQKDYLKGHLSDPGQRPTDPDWRSKTALSEKPSLGRG